MEGEDDAWDHGLPAVTLQQSHSWGSLRVMLSWAPYVEWPNSCCKFRCQGKPLPGPKCNQRAKFSVAWAKSLHLHELSISMHSSSRTHTGGRCSYSPPLSYLVKDSCVCLGGVVTLNRVGLELLLTHPNVTILFLTN